jgi:hypothetical protein
MKNKHQLEIMAAYMAYLSVGAAQSGLKSEAERAGSAAQLLQWVVDQKTPSTPGLDQAYQKAKGAFRALKKELPGSSHAEILDLLPQYLMDETRKQYLENLNGPQRSQPNP